MNKIFPCSLLICSLLVTACFLLPGCGSDSTASSIVTSASNVVEGDTVYPTPGQKVSVDASVGDTTIHDVYEYYVIDGAGNVSPYHENTDNMIGLCTSSVTNKTGSDKTSHITDKELENFLKTVWIQNAKKNTTIKDDRDSIDNFVQFLRKYCENDVDLMYDYYQGANLPLEEYESSIKAISTCFTQYDNPWMGFRILLDTMNLNFGTFNQELSTIGTTVDKFLSQASNNGYDYDRLVTTYLGGSWTSTSEFLTYVMNNAYQAKQSSIMSNSLLSRAVLIDFMEIAFELIEIIVQNSVTNLSKCNEYVLASQAKDPLQYTRGEEFTTPLSTLSINTSELDYNPPELATTLSYRLRGYYGATIPDEIPPLGRIYGYYIPVVLPVIERSQCYGENIFVNCKAVKHELKNEGGRWDNSGNPPNPLLTYRVYGRISMTKLLIPTSKDINTEYVISGKTGVRSPTIIN